MYERKEKKMGKKVLSVLCMVALVFTFCVGCGDSGAQGDTEQTYNFKLAMSYPTDHADTQAAQRAATGAACCTVCIPVGQSEKDLPWKCSTIWKVMRRASSPLHSRSTARMPTAI